MVCKYKRFESVTSNCALDRSQQVLAGNHFQVKVQARDSSLSLNPTLPAPPVPPASMHFVFLASSDLSPLRFPSTLPPLSTSFTRRQSWIWMTTWKDKWPSRRSAWSEFVCACGRVERKEPLRKLLGESKESAPENKWIDYNSQFNLIQLNQRIRGEQPQNSLRFLNVCEASVELIVPPSSDTNKRGRERERGRSRVQRQSHVPEWTEERQNQQTGAVRDESKGQERTHFHL